MEPIRIAFRAVKRLYGFFIIKPLQRYNIENRAFKALDLQQTSSTPLKPAPKHEVTREYLESIEREHPEVLEEIKKTPEDLLKRLQEVKVQSIGKDPISTRQTNLPVLTRAQPLPQFGVKDPEVVPPGKVSMRGFIEILNLKNDNPFKHTPAYFAKKYNVDQQHIKDVLDHFKSFNIYNPGQLSRSDVPWYSKKSVEDFILGGSAIYEHAKIEEEDREMEEARRLQAEQMKKREERLKLLKAEAESQEQIGEKESQEKIGEKESHRKIGEK